MPNDTSENRTYQQLPDTLVGFDGGNPVNQRVSVNAAYPGIQVITVDNGIQQIEAPPLAGQLVLVDARALTVDALLRAKPYTAVVLPSEEVATVPAGSYGFFLSDGVGWRSAFDTGRGSFAARAVVTGALPAYTVVGNTLTANAVGAPGSVFDGVTPSAGDQVLLQGGFAVAPADAGPWLITQMGTAGAKLTMVRPSWWTAGNFVPEGTKISIKEGTLFKNTQWSTWVTTATVVIGIGDPLLFPDFVTQQRNLVAGTFSIFNVPVRSALLSSVTCRRTGSVGDVSATVQYQATVGGVNGITPGQVGTASVVVEATLANAAGGKNAADTSAINVTISNL